MTPVWRDATAVELRAGYTVEDGAGGHSDRLTGVRVAFEGGFAHLAVPGVEGVQVVSAPAVHRIAYREA